MTTKEEKPGEGERQVCDECGEPSAVGYPFCDHRYAKLEAELAASKARIAELDASRAAYHQSWAVAGNIGEELKRELAESKARVGELEAERDEWKRRRDHSDSLLVAALDNLDRYWANLVAYQAFDDRLTDLLEGQAESKQPAGLHGRFVSYVERVVSENARLRAKCDLLSAAILMIGSELCGDPKIDHSDTSDPRWTPTLGDAGKLRAENAELNRVIAQNQATYRANTADLRATVEAIHELANEWWNHGDEVDALFAERLRAALRLLGRATDSGESKT